MVEQKLLSKPPLNVLFDPMLVSRKSPWEIDISELLNLFLEAATKSDIIDLRAAGTAALSSATIYRFKVESLFLFEQFQRRKKAVDVTEPPLIVVMPFRYELYSTSTEELFLALSKILEEIMQDQGRSTKTTPSVLEEVAPPSIDSYILSLQPLLRAFRGVLRERLRQLGRIQFTELVRGIAPIESARVFILLLFSAQNGEVVLEQDGEDILVISVGQLE